MSRPTISPVRIFARRSLAGTAALISLAGLSFGSEASLDAKPSYASAPSMSFQLRPAGSEADRGIDLKVSFKMRDGALASAGNFIVTSGSQSSYVVRGDKAVEIPTKGGKGVEFKQRYAVVNVLPAIRKDGQVDVQIQIELTGPLAPETSLKVQPMETFQLQTEFEATLGKPTVLVDEPVRYLEISIERTPSAGDPPETHRESANSDTLQPKLTQTRCFCIKSKEKAFQPPYEVINGGSSPECVGMKYESYGKAPWDNGILSCDDLRDCDKLMAECAAAKGPLCTRSALDLCYGRSSPEAGR